ncbi:hypothetical protein PIB30_100920, partial [Stylosanthes scabra]|nr:hypothetical protein [Stylosanthes scabra]
MSWLHTLREGNTAADTLAKKGQYLPLGLHLFDAPTPDINYALFCDCSVSRAPPDRGSSSLGYSWLWVGRGWACLLSLVKSYLVGKLLLLFTLLALVPFCIPQVIEVEEAPEVQVEVPKEKPKIIAEIKSQEDDHHPPQSSK